MISLMDFFLIAAGMIPYYFLVLARVGERRRFWAGGREIWPVPVCAWKDLPWWKFVQDLLLAGSGEEGAGGPVPIPICEGYFSPARPAHQHVSIVFTVPVCQWCQQEVMLGRKAANFISHKSTSNRTWQIYYFLEG